MQQVHRMKVNGSLLPKFINKNVSLMGTILKTSPNGRSFDIQTGDKHVVTVNVSEPLDDMLSGLVEVHGVVRTKDSVHSDYFINFPLDMSEKFDLEMDNEAVILLNNVPNPWK